MPAHVMKPKRPANVREEDRRRLAQTTWRQSAATFVGIALAATALTAITFATNPVTSSLSSDDGAYALQARSLADGHGWSVPHVLADVDPAGHTYPFVNSSVSDRGFFPGARHAVWSAVLAAGAWFAGVWGMRAIVFASFLAVVALTGKLAARASGDAVAVPAMLIAAASPLFVNALQLWAHVPATASVTVAMLGALAAMNGRARAPAVAMLLLGCMVAAALRGDSAVFALAVAAVVVMSGLRTRSISRVWIGISALVLSLVGVAAGRMFTTRITGASAAPLPSGTEASADSWIAGRWNGFMQTFLGDVSLGDGSFVLVVAGVTLSATAVLMWLRRQDDLASALLFAAAAVWIVRIVAFPAQLATGLIGAWPVVLLALARPRSRWSKDDLRLAAMVGIGSVGIVLTQYDVGGGANWGGRFLTPAIPALAVLVGGSITARVGSKPQAGRATIPAVGTLVVVLCAAPWILDMRVRQYNPDLVEKLEHVDDAVPIMTSALHVPRKDWASYPSRRWLLVPDGALGADRARDLLDRAAVDTVVFYLIPPDVAEAVAGRSLKNVEVRAGLLAEPVVVDGLR